MRQYSKDHRKPYFAFFGAGIQARNRFKVLPEFAIAIASENLADAELQIGLARLLPVDSQAWVSVWYSWLQLPKYREMLHTLAQYSADPSARAEALELAQQAGLDDKECARLAYELLDTDLSQIASESLITLLSRANSLEMSSETFDRLVTMATEENQRLQRLEMLRIMEKSQVVTPKSLDLLRRGLNDPPSNPRFQQALVTARKLGPKVRQLFPFIHSKLQKLKATSEGSLALEVDLKTVLDAIHPFPEPANPGDDNPPLGELPDFNE
jgi:hypothetical protein